MLDTVGRRTNKSSTPSEDKMEDTLKRREEEKICNQEREKEEEEEKRWREETLRKLAQILREKEEKREKAKSPTAEEIGQDNVIEVLVSRDGYKLIN